MRYRRFCEKNAYIICVKNVQIRKYFWYVIIPNTGKYVPELTPYSDTFHVVQYHDKA